MSKNAKKRKSSSESKKKYASKAEMAKRISLVHEMKLLGYQDHEILSFVNDGGKDGKDDAYRWSISYPSLRYYVTQGNKRSEDVLERDIRDHFNKAVKRWTFLVRKCHRDGDNTNLIKATKELDELLGLRKTNINITGLLNHNDVTGLTDVELDAQIALTEQKLL